jgi:hypothetical protein
VNRSDAPWDSPLRRPSQADKRRAWRRELLGEEVPVHRCSSPDAELV